MHQLEQTEEAKKAEEADPGIELPTKLRQQRQRKSGWLRREPLRRNRSLYTCNEWSKRGQLGFLKPQPTPQPAPAGHPGLGLVREDARERPTGKGVFELYLSSIFCSILALF